LWTVSVTSESRGRAKRIVVEELNGFGWFPRRPYPAGRYNVRFDGAGLASGVYISRLFACGGVATQKMVLVR
jgi:hypothetical protein